MDFGLSDDQRSMLDVWRTMGQNELAPWYTHWDRTGEFPWKPWRTVANAGLLGMQISEEYGGNPTDSLTVGLAIEELARHDFNVADSILIAALTGSIIEQHASAEVKAEWLPRIVSGQSVVGIALTESHAGSDVLALQATARRSGANWVLKGEKSGITFATIADAFIVLARTADSRSAKSVSAFLVPSSADGFASSGYEDLGVRMFGRGSIFLDEVVLPAHALLGREGTGFYEVMRGFDYTRVLIALMCLGAAAASVDETIEYVGERRAFGKSLNSFEGVSFPLVDALTQMRAARLMCYEGLWRRDNGLPHTKEAAMVKAWVPALCSDIIHQCLVLNGQFAYTQELPIEQRLRDVIGYELGDGAANIQKMIVAREVMGRESLPY